MKKAWLYNRKGRPGVYVHWYDAKGKQHSIRCPNKTSAITYKQQKEREMNSDLYCEPTVRKLTELVTEYVEYKRKVKRLAANSIVSIEDALTRNFGRFVGEDRLSTDINQNLINRYVADRNASGLSPATVNKDLRQLRPFVRWCLKYKYMGRPAKEIDWGELHQREPKRAVRTYSIDELLQVLAVAIQLYGESWYVRIVLAVSTGLRQCDIDDLNRDDVLPDNALNTRSRKTQKAMNNRPIHPLVGQVLRSYLSRLPPAQTRLLPDEFSDSKWHRILDKANVKAKFHELRKTFASFILRNGYDITVAQKLLEHETPLLTQQVYANIDPVRRRAVESIPMEKIIGATVSRFAEPASAKPEQPPDDT
jgi:integrase